MDVKYFNQLWSEGKTSRAPGKSFWNNRADEFNNSLSQGGSNERISKIFNFLSANNLLTDKSSILDIGCGPGRFAVEFAKKSSEVIGLDISEKMLDHAANNAKAEKLSNLSFKNLNWDEVNLEEYGWHKKFDLVTAINSPGIHNLNTLEKMIESSRGYCFLTNFVERFDSIQDIIRTEILQLEEARFFRNTVYSIFNILWLKGYYPRITYVDTDREHTRTIDEACRYYSTFFEAENDEDEKFILIKNYLNKIAVNSLVRERVRSKTAWIYWSVQNNS